jgi:hypothetical protein
MEVDLQIENYFLGIHYFCRCLACMPDTSSGLKLDFWKILNPGKRIILEGG